MTHKEFSSAGGKAMKGTPQARERARKGGLAAAAKRKAESLADRSPFVARKEAEGKARGVDEPRKFPTVPATGQLISQEEINQALDDEFGMDQYAENQRKIRRLQPKVSSEEAHEQARRQNAAPLDSGDDNESRIVYDNEKWTLTPDME